MPKVHSVLLQERTTPFQPSYLTLNPDRPKTLLTTHQTPELLVLLFPPMGPAAEELDVHSKVVKTLSVNRAPQTDPLRLTYSIHY